MEEMKPISSSRNNLYKVAVILLLAYAAFSTAMKDLNHLQEVAGNVHEVTAQGLGGIAKVYSVTRSLAEEPLPARASEFDAPTPMPRVEMLAAGGSFEFAGFQKKPILRSSERESIREVVVRPETKFAVYKTFKGTCDTDKPKPIATWDVVAQLPRRSELLRHSLKLESNPDVEILATKRPRVRTIINRLPAKGSKSQWTNVSEFKSLQEVISLGFTIKQTGTEDVQLRGGEMSEEGYRYIFERALSGESDSATDNATNE